MPLLMIAFLILSYLKPPITSLEKSMENVKIPTNYLKYPRKSLTGSHLFIKLEQANKDDVERPPTEPNDVTLKMTPDGHVDEDEDGKSRYKVMHVNNFLKYNDRLSTYIDIISWKNKLILEQFVLLDLSTN